MYGQATWDLQVSTGLALPMAVGRCTAAHLLPAVDNAHGGRASPPPIWAAWTVMRRVRPSHRVTPVRNHDHRHCRRRPGQQGRRGAPSQRRRSSPPPGRTPCTPPTVTTTTAASGGGASPPLRLEQPQRAETPRTQQLRVALYVK